MVTSVGEGILYTVEPLNNESIGTANFFSLFRGFFLLRGTNILKGYIERDVFTLGEFIIGDSTVYKI